MTASRQTSPFDSLGVAYSTVSSCWVGWCRRKLTPALRPLDPPTPPLDSISASSARTDGFHSTVLELAGGFALGAPSCFECINASLSYTSMARWGHDSEVEPDRGKELR